MSHPQEIFNPVIARLRAFSWPEPRKKRREPRNKSANNNNYDDNCAVANLSNEALLDVLSVDEPRGKRIKKYRQAQAELQRRYIQQLAASIPDWKGWGGRTVILDTETQNVETGQAMRFGVAQMRGYGYRELIEFMVREGRPPSRGELDTLREVIIFYDPAMLEMDQSNLKTSIAILENLKQRRESASGVPHRLMTRDEFVEQVLFRNERIKGDIPLPVLVIGHKLDFDIQRLSVYPATMARGEFVYGGFSIPMGRSVKKGGDRKGEPNGPRVVMKKIGPGKNSFRAVSNYNAQLRTHEFVDTLMLAKALLGADTPASMDALCGMFGLEDTENGPISKENVKHFKPLTREYADYGYNDVERTWFIYTKLRELVHKHNRTAPMWNLYSVASVGKAYYKDFGINKYLEKNITGQNDAHSLKSLKLCGVAMEAMIGARAECGVRHQIREVINKDFKSQYPTINIKLKLQDLLLAERVDIEEDERLASGEWLKGGKDAALLEAISILDLDDCPPDGDASQLHVYGSRALLGKDKAASNSIWPDLIGFAQVDPADCILPIRTCFQDEADKDDGKASTNVSLTEIEHGPLIWVTYLDVLASKFLTGLMPRILKTIRMIPVGRQANLKEINFFGNPNYVVDLAQPDTDIFRSILEMRDAIKAEMEALKRAGGKGSPEYDRLDAMQLALKLIANSTAYGVSVQVDVDEREEDRGVSIFHGEEVHRLIARKKVRGDDGREEVSSVKVEKPCSWFAPWGSLITAGGRLLIAMAEALARVQGRDYGGIPYGMCDTDSMAFARPLDMPRAEFRDAVARIGGYFQRINPYKPVNGDEPEVFATELEDKDEIKPLYILSISAKRYAMANIIREDGSDYDTLSEMRDDGCKAVVILRKVSAHGLGPITAPGYARPPDDGAHLAVPFKKNKKGDYVLKNGRRVPLYSEVCHGKGNARLFLDMWKLAFEMFVQYEGKKTGREIARGIMDEMSEWPGLDKPQFKQRVLNTWNQWTQYKSLPNRRAGMFFNVLPSPMDAGNALVGYSYDIDQYYNTSLYCQGGTDIDAENLLQNGRMWWLTEDNEPANKLVGSMSMPYRLQTVAEAIGPYFDSQEFKAKGEYGALERHRVAVFQREYVGKETNYLLDPDIHEEDETQIEDKPEEPYFRQGFSPALMKQYLSTPDIVETLGVASLKALKGIMSGYAPSSHARRVLAHLRKGSRYNETTRTVEYDGFIREVAMKEREAARLVDLMRRAYDKMNAVCMEHNSAAKLDDFDGPPSFRYYHIKRKPIVEMAAHFKLISDTSRHNSETQNCAYELLHPLLRFDQAADFLEKGIIRSQTGAELRKDDIFKLLEDYLGITEYKERAAENVKVLKIEQPRYREKRKKQSLDAILNHILKPLNSDDFDKVFKAARGSMSVKWTAEFICACAIVLLLAVAFSLRGFQAVVRKHVSDRKTRPDVNRFEFDLTERLSGEKDRKRLLARRRKQKSRSNQATKASNSSINVGLGSGSSLQESAG